MNEELLLALKVFLDTDLDRLLEPGETTDGSAKLFQLLRDVAKRVSAYRQLLAEHGIDATDIASLETFRRLPLVTKDSYVRRFPLQELVTDGDLSRCDFFAVSSGSTGEPTLWPRGQHHELSIAVRFEQVFRDSFRAQDKSTLAVVCFALGTWVGGMFTTSCLRWLAAKGYRIMIATPGNKIDEILRVVRQLSPRFEQTVLLGYPPFLKEVVDAGRADGIDWSPFDVRLVLAGEVFSETWRDLVLDRLGQPDRLGGAASLYGTADAGVLGNETPLSVAIRRFLSENDDAARAIFGEERLPTLCQYDACQRYFEAIDGTLAFSGDNGVPLLRYHIADSGGVHSFDEMLTLLRDFEIDPVFQVDRSGFKIRRQPFVHVFGRANFTVSYFGANIFPETLSLALEHPAINGWTTGKFVMQVKEGLADRPKFTVAIELADGAEANAERVELASRTILDTLRHHNSEFANYVPLENQVPEITLWRKGHPDYFPVGVKHRYSRR